MLDFGHTAGIFENFEVNRDPFWLRVRWLLAGSLAWHIFALFVVVMVPQVRDTLAIATIFVETGVVDRPYTKTEIGDFDITEITTEKFRYPDGYFMVANGEMPLPAPSPTPPMIASAPFTPAPVPQFDPSATPSPSPTATATPLVASNASPTPTPSPDAETQKAIDENEKALDRAAAEAGMERPKEINTRPFKDLLTGAKKLKDEGKLNLSGQVEVIAEADLDPAGKLLNVRVTGKADKTLEKTALDFIAALSDSGVLSFLKGAKHLRLIAKLDDKTVEVVAATEADSIESAEKLERYIGSLIVGGRFAAKLKDKQDELTYFNHTQVARTEKEVNLKFSMPRADLGAMLSKHAAEK